MEESSMKKHVTLVAALQIGFSTIGIIGAAVIYLVLSFAVNVVQDVEVAGPILKFMSGMLPAMILLVSLLGLLGGIGLLSFQKWARILVMVITAVGCLAFPVGTIVGVYSLWVLMQDDTVKLFK
jgi:hypothetical protein